MRKRPLELKIVSGTNRPDRQQSAGVEIPPLLTLPDPPEWLTNSHALAEWHRLAPILVGNRLLNEANVSVLAVMCSAYAEVIKCSQGEIPPNAALYSQFRALVAEFGLTPASRGRVKLDAAGGAPTNRFSKFSERNPHNEA